MEPKKYILFEKSNPTMPLGILTEKKASRFYNNVRTCLHENFTFAQEMIFLDSEGNQLNEEVICLEFSANYEYIGEEELRELYLIECLTY